MKFGLVPSYLASLAANGDTCQIGEHEILWDLVQEPGRKLKLISNIQSGSTRDGGYGSFAFVIEPTLQTQPGHRRPEQALIAFFVSARRFLDAPLRVSDYKRLHNIMVRINQPRLTNWPASATWVYLPAKLRSVEDAQYAAWAHGASDLLQALKPDTLYPLPSVEDFVRDPLAFRKPGPGRPDICLGVYAEGLEPDHALEVGISPHERYLVVKRDMERRFAGILTPTCPPSRVYSGLTPDRACQPLMMLSSRDLVGHESVAVQAQALVGPRKRVRKKDQETVAKATELRLRRNRIGRDLHLMLFRRQTTASVHTQHVIRTMMHSLYGEWPNDEAGTWIEGVSFSAHTVNAELEQALQAINPATGKPEKDPEKREALLAKAWDAKRRMWADYLASECKRVPAGRQAVALIEMPRPPFDNPRAPESIKGAVRAAFIQHNIASQMLVSFGGRRQSFGQKNAMARNAIQEVLLRQSGVNYGDIADLNARLNLDLSREFAHNLTLIGVFRKRSSSTNTDYVLAVRITPGGLIEARVPGMQTWEPYLKISLLVGKDFVNRRAKQSSKAQLLFLEDLLLEARTGPTLVMLVADHWRNNWPSMLNEQIERNQFLLPSRKEARVAEDIATPETQPDLNIVILRTRGEIGETPDFAWVPAATQADGAVDVQFVEESSLFRDTEAPEEFEVYLSIGRRPITTKGLEPDSSKYDDGDVANRQQQAVEITPWFVQKGIEADQLARLTHVLRDVVPWWEGGSLTFPYPLQLARAVLDDMVWASGLEKSSQPETD